MTKNNVPAALITKGTRIAFKMTGRAGAFKRATEIADFRDAVLAAGVSVAAVVKSVREGQTVLSRSGELDPKISEMIRNSDMSGFSASAVSQWCSVREFFDAARVSIVETSALDAIAYAAIQTVRKGSLADVAAYIAEWSDDERADADMIVGELNDARADYIAVTKLTKTERSPEAPTGDDFEETETTEPPTAEFAKFAPNDELTASEFVSDALQKLVELAQDRPADRDDIARQLRDTARLISKM